MPSSSVTVPRVVKFSMPFGSRCHPDLAAARLRSLDWARRAGLVLTEADERRYLLRRWCDEFLRVKAGLAGECARRRLSREETEDLLRLVAGLEEAIGGQPDWYRVTGRYGHLIPKGEPAYGSNLLGDVSKEG